ncbi:hypothetical protein [Sphingomonas pituitosa]|uniref:hypothetical protein n=1 Tax=Sphingomonas pituitosa TaxID=99597 RepID=UPI00082FC781|nr:hypothetical protein [Sphingomonas pituitosa]
MHDLERAKEIAGWPSDMLQRIQREMAFMGWKGPADTGFTHKEDVNGERIARAHDATWHADYAESEARQQRLAVRRILEDQAC